MNEVRLGCACEGTRIRKPVIDPKTRKNVGESRITKKDLPTPYTSSTGRMSCSDSHNEDLYVDVTDLMDGIETSTKDMKVWLMDDDEKPNTNDEICHVLFKAKDIYTVNRTLFEVDTFEVGGKCIIQLELVRCEGDD